MAITFTSTDPTLTGIDYIKYLIDRPVITRDLNVPSLLDMTLAKWGNDFVLPRRGSYFILGTTANPKFWTGYLIEDPELEYLGKRADDDQPQWSWKFQGTSDEYILSLAPLGILPVYINQTQGAIIKDLANRIAPGKFDTTNVDDGQLVPYFFADPTRVFSEIVKDFSESAYYAFWANDYKLYYKRQDNIESNLIINGKTEYANRVRILSSTNATPIVITTVSAHGRSNGDCITVNGHLVNTNANGNWIIQNVTGSTLELVNSVGNGVGGNTGWAGLHNPHFTPERLQIGPVNDPVINDCIIIGDIEPQGTISEYFVGDGLTNSFPMLSSIFGVDSALLLDEVFTGNAIDSNKWLEVDSSNNSIQVDNGYLNVIGSALDAYGVYLQSKALIPLQGHLRLTHGEYDFVSLTNNDGVIASLWTAQPSYAGGDVPYPGCVYGIRVTANGVAVTLNPIINGIVQTDDYTALSISDNKRYIIRTLVTFENIYRHDRESLFRLITGTVGSYGGNTVSDHPVYRTIITEIDAETGKSTTNQIMWKNDGPNTGLANTQFYAAYVPILSNNLHLTLSNITISVPMQVSLETINKEAWYPERIKYDIVTGAPVPFDLTTQSWEPRIIGPNEIESYDNMSPVATILTSRQGRIDQGNILGSTLYNPGDASLTFFKDSIKQTANTPTPGQIIHLKYRRAGIAIGRAQNSDLIASEAAIWGDNGYRTLTRKDLNPLPRTAVECEQAAAAIVEENSYQHFAGTYTQFSNYEFIRRTISGGAGQARSFDGTTANYLKAEGIGLFTNISCQCAWITVNALGGVGTIFGNNFDAGYEMQINAANELQIAFTESAVTYTLSAPLTIAGGASQDYLQIGVPLFVAVNITHSEAGSPPVTADFYAGQDSASVALIGSDSAGTFIASNGTQFVFIGSNNNGSVPEDPFNGVIDRVGRWADNLSLGELQAIAGGADPLGIPNLSWFYEITGEDPEPNSLVLAGDASIIGSPTVTTGLVSQVIGSSNTPIPGGILLFKNMPTTFPSIQAEQITKVVSVLESKSQEIFTHEITFGKADQVRKFLSGLKETKNPFAPTDTAEVPTAQDLTTAIESTNALSIIFNTITLTLTYGGTSSTITSTALDIDLQLKLKDWTGNASDTIIASRTIDQEDLNYFIISIGQAPPEGGGFEIRYSDQGWGDANNKNFLVYGTITNGQTTEQEFKIARKLNAAVFVKAFDASGRYSRYASAIRIVFPGIPGNPSDIEAKGGTLTYPIFKAHLPITTSGTTVLNGDVFGLVSFFNHELSLSTNVFTDNRGVGTSISPFTPIGVDNPGPYRITPTSEGYDYAGANVFLGGGATIFDSGFINFETEIPMSKGVSIFFCWVRAIGITADDGLYIRLNIKDDLLPGQSVQPFGFYSRHDYLLTGGWQPLFTIVDLLQTPRGPTTDPLNYNLVIHNIGEQQTDGSFANAPDLNLKICIPLLGISFYNQSDIVLGASDDSPGLNFTYHNIGAN